MRHAPKDIVVGVIDVGSPRNIGWAVLFDGQVWTGDHLDEFVRCFAEHAGGRPAALGFEAPLFIPLRSDPKRLTAQRDGEKGKPWSAGAGATVTTIGLAVMTYTLSALLAPLRGTAATLDWNQWPDGNAMLVFEAFVTGVSHAAPGEHWRDAQSAAEAFVEALPDLDAVNAVTGGNVLSLAGACLARTGWSKPSVDLLSQACLVIRPKELAPK